MSDQDRVKRLRVEIQQLEYDKELLEEQNKPLFGRNRDKITDTRIQELKTRIGLLIRELDELQTHPKSSVMTTASILFLAAVPTNASRLRVGEEFREIQEKLKLAKMHERFRLEIQQWSSRPDDITQ